MSATTKEREKEREAKRKLREQECERKRKAREQEREKKRREKAEKLRLTVIWLQPDWVAGVKIKGGAKLECERCKVEGAPSWASRREEKHGRHHRAWRAPRLMRRRACPTVVVRLFVECGRCWARLKAYDASKVPGAEEIPLRDEKGHGLQKETA